VTMVGWGKEFLRLADGPAIGTLGKGALMYSRRFWTAGLVAAIGSMLAAAPASAAVIVYAFEGMGMLKTKSYTRDYIFAGEQSSQQVYDNAPFSATLTIDTRRLDGSSGGLVAEWQGGPDRAALAGSALSAPRDSSDYDRWSTPDDRGVVFSIARTSLVDRPDGTLVNDSLTSTARLRLVDNEPGLAPMSLVDGYWIPDLTGFVVEFSLNTMAFSQLIDFADLFVENGEITQIFSVGRATTHIIVDVPEPRQLTLLLAGTALLAGVSRLNRRRRRIAMA